MDIVVLFKAIRFNFDVRFYNDSEPVTREWKLYVLNSAQWARDP